MREEQEFMCSRGILEIFGILSPLVKFEYTAVNQRGNARNSLTNAGRTTGPGLLGMPNRSSTETRGKLLESGKGVVGHDSPTGK